MIRAEFTVNGAHRDATFEPGTSLLEVIRDDLGLTGAKEGCGKGECGACTVIMDNKAIPHHQKAVCVGVIEKNLDCL